MTDELHTDRARFSVPRSAAASVYFDWAVSPEAAASMHIYIFGEKPTPVTEEMVREEFGDKAADAWRAAKDAKAAYWAAVKDKPHD